MNRDRVLLSISILIFVSLGVYYLRPVLKSLTSRRSVSRVAAKPSPSQSLPRRFTGGGFSEARPEKGEAVDELTPWGRNPFLTKEEEERGKRPGGDGLRVKAVIIGQPEPVATINGHTVMVGEEIRGETVAEIRPDGVVLERNGRKRVLKIREPSIPIQIREGMK